ncbi:Calmodulin-4 [Symbiodinium microadriaticum]|uniref:Calmodulin-4 n=1 Tax=Symbiodinium microadriaticum TaxID=2951 RepID=A0A1Q9E3Z4_SYMMI|nr:Calmodulin-4 [Symbiodinium microadriaticum]
MTAGRWANVLAGVAALSAGCPLSAHETVLLSVSNVGVVAPTAEDDKQPSFESCAWQRVGQKPHLLGVGCSGLRRQQRRADVRGRERRTNARCIAQRATTRKACLFKFPMITVTCRAAPFAFAGCGCLLGLRHMQSAVENSGNRNFPRLQDCRRFSDAFHFLQDLGSRYRAKYFKHSRRPPDGLLIAVKSSAFKASPEWILGEHQGVDLEHPCGAKIRVVTGHMKGGRPAQLQAFAEFASAESSADVEILTARGLGVNGFPMSNWNRQISTRILQNRGEAKAQSPLRALFDVLLDTRPYSTLPRALELPQLSRPPNKQALATAMSAGSVEEWAQKDSLQALFNRIDSNCDGTLSTDELRRALCAIGLKSADVTTIYKIMDTNCDDRVSYTEFVKWLFHGSSEAQVITKKVMGGPATASEAMDEFVSYIQELKDTPPAEGEKPTKLRDIFRKMDENGSGKISFTEFHSSCKSLGFDMSDEMLKEVFDQIDVQKARKKKKKPLTQEEQDEIIAEAKARQAEDPSVEIPEFMDGFPKGDISCWLSHEKVYYCGSNKKYLKQRRLIYDPYASTNRDFEITFAEFKKAFNAVIPPKKSS